MAKNEKKRTFFEKMFSRSIWPVGLIVLVILAFSVILLFRGYRDANNATLNSRHEKLTQLCTSIDTELNQLERVQRRILSIDAISQIAYFYGELDYYTYYTLIHEVEEDLSHMVDDYRYAQNAWVCFLQPQITVSQFGYSTKAPLDNETLLEIGSQMLCQSGTSLYCIRKRSFYHLESGQETPICAIVVELDAASLLSTLSYLCQDDETVRLYMPDGSLWAKTPGEQAGGSLINHTSETYDFTVELQINASHLDDTFDQLKVIVLLFALLVLALSVFFLWDGYQAVYKPLKLLLVDAFEHVNQGNLSYRIPPQPNSPMASIYERFNAFLAQMEFYVETNLRQKMLISEANFKQLQTQINPHFMYNSYYMLYRLIQDEDWENSRALAQHLGQFYQYITRNGSDEKPLETEVRHARAYADIQAMRYKSIHVEFADLPMDYEQIIVPKLILQPVIENVFTHAHEYADNPQDIILRISYHEQPQSGLLDIVVENSGALTQQQLEVLQSRLEHADEQEENTALINIHKRLRFCFGSKAGLLATQSKLGGLCITLRIVLE